MRERVRSEDRRPARRLQEAGRHQLPTNADQLRVRRGSPWVWLELNLDGHLHFGTHHVVLNTSQWS